MFFTYHLTKDVTIYDVRTSGNCKTVISVCNLLNRETPFYNKVYPFFS